MKILFINSDTSIRSEFNEFAGQIDAEILYSGSTEQSIITLNEHEIDIVVLKIGKLADVSILKYIDDYYKHIKVLVCAREDFDEALTIFNQVHFEKIKNPMGLKDLKEHLVH
jgi:DNA-binding NtrC family response regulator